MLVVEAAAPSRRMRLPPATPPTTLATGAVVKAKVTPLGQISNVLVEVPSPSVKKPAAASLNVTRPAVWLFSPM